MAFLGVFRIPFGILPAPEIIIYSIKPHRDDFIVADGALIYILMPVSVNYSLRMSEFCRMID